MRGLWRWIVRNWWDEPLDRAAWRGARGIILPVPKEPPPEDPFEFMDKDPFDS